MIIDRLAGSLTALTFPEPSAFRGSSKWISYVVPDQPAVFMTVPSNSIVIASLKLWPQLVLLWSATRKGFARHLSTGSAAEQSLARSAATAKASDDAKMSTIGVGDFIRGL